MKKLLLIHVVLALAALYFYTSQKNVTLRGVFQPTKDGGYVNGILIPEENLPKGFYVDDLAGKEIEVRGAKEEVTGLSEKQINSEIKSQGRQGKFWILKNIKSIRIITN